MQPLEQLSAPLFKLTLRRKAGEWNGSKGEAKELLGHSATTLDGHMRRWLVLEHDRKSLKCQGAKEQQAAVGLAIMMQNCVRRVGPLAVVQLLAWSIPA